MRRTMAQWWEAPEGQAHESVFSLAVALRDSHKVRRYDNQLLRNLYRAKGYTTSLHGDVTPLQPMWDAGGLRFNLIRAAVDTLTARVWTSKPKATFTTTGGTWSQQRRAKRLDRYVYGAMHAADFYRKLRIAGRDAALTDMGAIKGVVENGRIRLERVDSNELLVDFSDAYYGRPSALLHTYVMSRERAHVMVDVWHEDSGKAKRDAMHAAVGEARASTDPRLNMARVQSAGDVVEVNEVWRLPMTDDDVGRHVLALSSATLVDEDCSFFPFAFARLIEPFQGWYAQGLGEILAPHQRSWNIQAEATSEILRKMSLSRYFIRHGSELNMRHVQKAENAIIIEGDEPPTLLAQNAIPSEHWKVLEDIVRRAYEEIGLNEMSVAVRKPAGLDSGVAQREYQDSQNMRLSPYFQAVDDCVADTARLIVNLSRQAAEDGEALKADALVGRGYQPIDWKSAAMDETSYRLQVFSANSLPARPEARRQHVSELWQSGQIDSAEYRRLLDVPDTDAASDLALAARDVIDMHLEHFLDTDDGADAHERYIPPEPFDDLAYAVRRGMLVLNQARQWKAPERALELVRRFALDARAMLEASQPQQQSPSPEALTQRAAQLATA